MDNFKCLSAHVYDNLNKKDTSASVDSIDACETLPKELYKSLKIAKIFKEELKLANLEKEELVLRLDESNKKAISKKSIFLSGWKDEKFGKKKVS